MKTIDKRLLWTGTLGLAAVLAACTVVPLRRWWIEVAAAGQRRPAIAELVDTLRAAHEPTRPVADDAVSRFFRTELADSSAWLTCGLANLEVVRGARPYASLLALLRAEEDPLSTAQRVFRRSRSAHVRAALVLAAGDLKLGAGASWLGGLLASSYASRDRALFESSCAALETLGTPEAARILCDALDRAGPDVLWNRPLCDSAGSLGDVAFAPLLRTTRRALEAEDYTPGAYHMLLGTLRNMKDETPLIALAQGTARVELRAMAVHALGSNGTERGRELLLDVLANEAAPEILRAALSSITDCANEATFDALVDVLRRDELRPGLPEAVRALQRLGAERAGPVLVELLEDATPVEASTLIVALARCDTSLTRSVLLEKWTGGSHEVKLDIVEALYWSRERAVPREFLTPLADVLQAHESWLPVDIGRATSALVRVDGGGEVVVASILAGLREMDDPRRRQVVRAIGSVTDPRIERAVAELTEADSLLTRIMAFEFLSWRESFTRDASFERRERETALAVIRAFQRFEISQFMLASPRGRTENGGILARFLGRVARAEDVPALEELRDLHARVVRGSALAAAIELILVPVRARQSIAY